MNRDPISNTGVVRPAPGDDFAANEVRLSWRQWLVALAIAGGVLTALPGVWWRVKPLAPSADYRVPYGLSEDYELFERHCRTACEAGRTLVVGDSVVWGHYVSADRTLSAALNRLAGAGRFANLGTDGIHPAALAGLIEHHGEAMAGRSVILHGNLLWMSTPRHDLTDRKERVFNHPKLVPQFSPWIRCYDADVSERLSVAVRRRVPVFAWAEHVRLTNYDGNDVPRWTIDHPYECPADRLSRPLPDCRAAAALPHEAVAWTKRDKVWAGDPPWVELGASLQWAQFRRAVEILVARGSRVFVVVGPYNEHMLKAESLARYRRRLGAVSAWLRGRGIPHWVPAALPSELYADASHPLADGYQRWARRLYEQKDFAAFDGRSGR